MLNAGKRPGLPGAQRPQIPPQTGEPRGGRTWAALNQLRVKCRAGPSPPSFACPSLSVRAVGFRSSSHGTPKTSAPERWTPLPTHPAAGLYRVTVSPLESGPHGQGLFFPALLRRRERRRPEGQVRPWPRVGVKRAKRAPIKPRPCRSPREGGRRRWHPGPCLASVTSKRVRQEARAARFYVT